MRNFPRAINLSSMAMPHNRRTRLAERSMFIIMLCDCEHIRNSGTEISVKRAHTRASMQMLPRPLCVPFSRGPLYSVMVIARAHTHSHTQNTRSATQKYFLFRFAHTSFIHLSHFRLGHRTTQKSTESTVEMAEATEMDEHKIIHQGIDIVSHWGKRLFYYSLWHHRSHCRTQKNTHTHTFAQTQQQRWKPTITSHRIQFGNASIPRRHNFKPFGDWHRWLHQKQYRRRFLNFKTDYQSWATRMTVTKSISRNMENDTKRNS